MSIEIYMDYLSQPARAVLALCKIGKITTKITEKRIFKGEHQDKDIVKLNPLWTLPFIIDHDNNDFRLTESHAIMRYLLNTRSMNFNDNIYPNDPTKSAKIEEYLDWHHTNTRKTAFYILSIRAPNVDIISLYKKDKLETDFIDSLLTINHYFLKDDKFIGGMDDMSIADLSAYFELLQLLLIDFDFSPYPRICTWMKKMMNVKEVEEANKEFMAMLPKILKKKEIKPRF